MIFAFDLLWWVGALVAWGLPGLAAGSVLHRGGLAWGWPTACALLPVAYLVFLVTLVLTVGGLARLLPKPRPGTTRVFRDGPFFVFLVHWGLERYVPRPFITHIQLITTLRTLYYRLMGARLGWSTHLSPGCEIFGPGLVELGHLTYVGEGAQIATHLSQGDKLVMAPVVLGDRCSLGAGVHVGPGCTFGSDVRVAALTDIAPGAWIEDEAEIGPRCQLGMGVKVGKGSRLEPRTFLDSWTAVPAGEVWAGDPGRKVGEIALTAAARKRRARKRIGG